MCYRFKNIYIQLYQLLCLCVHFFQVLDVLLLDHEDFGKPCLIVEKIRQKNLIGAKCYEV